MLTLNRGFFGRGDMQKEFEEASFALEKGQVSKVVETASGLHLIQRSAIHPSIQRFNTNLSRPDWSRLHKIAVQDYTESTDGEMNDMCNERRVLRRVA